VKGFWEISFDLDGLEPPFAEQLCWLCGASSVTFADARDNPVLEPLPGEFRLWPSTRLHALFSADLVPLTLVRALSDGLAIAPERLRAALIEDRTWEREWLRHFRAMRFGSRLWVAPHHESVTADDAIVVRLDPGLAFGTGTHPTTALCLEWLDRHMAPGEKMIDYGCGSGILGISAVKLGVAHAHCFDIDPQALLATEENARLNDVSSHITVHRSSQDLPSDVELLVANILSGPLCELAPAFASAVRRAGGLLLGGLLESQVSDVTQAYSAWFDIHPFDQREGWVGLAGRRH
jgi:ribosomal protein L11 methyltransferase